MKNQNTHTNSSKGNAPAAAALLGRSVASAVGGGGGVNGSTVATCRSLVLVGVFLFLSGWQACRLYDDLTVVPLRPTIVYPKRSWKEQAVLSTRGLTLPIPTPLDLRTSRKIQHGNVTLVVDLAVADAASAAASAPVVRDMSLALKYVLDQLQLDRECRLHPEASVIVEVGGLKGDFGLTVASQTNCHTVIYEAQEWHAMRMAQSILLPENHKFAHTVKIRHAAVSPKPWVSFVTATTAKAKTKTKQNALPVSATTASTRILTEQLDEEFDRILLLKVDVEGGEDDVLVTAKRLLWERNIQHAILEYTPHHFHGRQTDYATLLPRFFSLTTTTPATAAAAGDASGDATTAATTAATTSVAAAAATTHCYALHCSKAKLYRIQPSDVDIFYQTLYESKIQTDLYCYVSSSSFSSSREDVFYASTPVWTRSTRLNGS